MRPISLESVILASGMTERTMSALCSSKVELTGENTEEMAMAFKPASRIFSAISAHFVRLISGDLASVKFVPAVCQMGVATDDVRRSSGQSTIGGRQTVAGKPRRMQAVGVRCLRSTTALVKCVVPIITPSMLAVSMPESSITVRNALAMPSDTLAVVVFG